MNNYLIIKNDGEIENGALTLIGASTKEGDDSKIGFFGSGNKYAMATLLRNDIPFRIFSGIKEIKVTTKEVSVRGVPFKQIYVNNKPTSLTTRMGPSWPVWFALRELVCNAIDEGGYKFSECEEIEPILAKGTTTISVEINSDVREFIDNYSKYLFNPETNDYAEFVEKSDGYLSEAGYIIENDGNFNFYRKGVSIIQDRERPSLYSYYTEDSRVDINESRVYMYGFQIDGVIANLLARSRNKDIIKNFLSHAFSDSYRECNLQWSYVNSFSLEWLKVLKDEKIGSKSMREMLPPEDRLRIVFVEDDLFKRMKELMPNLNYVGGEAGWMPIADNHPGKVELGEQIERAKETLSSIGFQVTSKIVLGHFTDKEVIAQYHSKIDEIRMSVQHMGDDEENVLTLLEEHLHSEGYRDGSRAFELILMKMVVKARTFIGEHILKSQEVLCKAL